MRDVRRGFVVQDWDYREAIPKAAEWDLDFVEIPMEGHHDRHRIRSEANSVGALSETEHVDLVVHLPFKVDLCSPYERVREAMHREMEDCIEAASVVDARKAVLHPRTDAWLPAYDEDELREELIERILDLDSYAEHAGVELCVENLKGDFFTVEDHFTELFERDVSMTLDTGHAYVEGWDAKDQAAFLLERKDSVSHVHLNDTRTDGDDEHLPFGAGTIDFDTLLDPLREDWAGTLALEVWTDDWEYVEESVRRLDELFYGRGIDQSIETG